MTQPKKQTTQKKKPLSATEKRIRAKKNKVLKEIEKMPIIQIAVAKAGVSRATYYRWCNEDSEFRLAADTALYDGSALIVDMAESKLFAKVKEGELKAITFFLQHRDHRYAQKQRIEIPRPGPVTQIGDKTKQAVDRVFALFERTARRIEGEYKNVDQNS